MFYCPLHPTQELAGKEEAKKIIARHTGYFHHVRQHSYFEDKPGLIYGPSIGCAIYTIICKEEEN
jgi:hypothetical protein